MNIGIGKDFLLDTQTARSLYLDAAQGRPVHDFHNHLSVRDIAGHRRFRSLTELWLEGDHYKWRAMRANGVPERLVTGDGEAYEKFTAWAAVLPKLPGSPLWHWTHLELSQVFGIDKALTPESAGRIWEKTRSMLQSDGFDTVSLLKKFGVRTLCTTDDPADSLEWHRAILQDPEIPFRVLPTFRPDRYLIGDRAANEALCAAYGTDSLQIALGKALDRFCENGCRAADHGFSSADYGRNPERACLLGFLGREYARRDITMQLHLGALRDVSPKLLREFGHDAGGDCTGGSIDPLPLANLLAELEREDALPRTILYNLNPSDSRVFATLAGSYAPRVQYGMAWWFSDHLRGIGAWLDEMLETGALAASVGMLTDSRSFTSFVRHDYFRRILCRRLGRLVEDGMYPPDTDALRGIVTDVCCENAKRFFGF